MNDTETVLITGASSGIGLALARDFASHGHPLVIVSPVAEKLEEVAEKIQRKFGVEVTPVAKDLREENAALEIFEELQEKEIEIHTLVNNAGLGQKGKFSSTPLERDIDMIRVNMEAVLRMTKLFMQPMLDQNSGRILNTASVAGFEPGPLLAVYHATKAFVLSFTEALAVELEETGLTVTVLCPGPTDTDFFPKAGMMKTRAFQKAGVMAPADVAKAGYEALMKGDRVCVPGGMNKVLVNMRRWMTVPATARFNKKMYEEVPLKERSHERGDFEKKSRREKEMA